MELEENIQKLIEKADLTRSEIMELINKKKKEFDGLMTDEGALQLIAEELDISLDKKLKPPRRPITLIQDITPQKTLVNLVGRVQKIYDVKTFTRKKTNTEGKVGSFIIEDKTGQIRVVLWDRQTEIIETHQIEEDMPIYIENGTVKSGQNGLEIHVGRRTKIDNPPQSLLENIPEKIEIYQIKNLQPGMKGINVHGTINWMGEIKEFKRSDGSIGQVIPVIIRDETGSIKCSAWDMKAEDIMKYKVGDSIRLDNVSVKKNNMGNLEINTNIDTIINKEIKLIISKNNMGTEFKIDQLNPKSKNVNIKFKVVQLNDSRQIISKNGNEFKIADFLIADETGCINLTAWNEDIEKIHVGKVYQIINGYINEFRGSISLNIGKFGEIKELDEEINDINLENNISNVIYNSLENRKFIKDVKDKEFVQIRGAIVKVFKKKPIYEACPNCMKKVVKIEDKWECPNCGIIDNIIFRMIWSFVLDDGTGNIRVTVGGKFAEDLLGFDAIAAQEIIEHEWYDEAPLKIKENELLGKEIIIIGTIRRSDFTGDLEIFASKVENADPLKEADIIFNQIQ